MKKKIALIMIAIDLSWHVMQAFGYYPFTFPNHIIYDTFWIVYWSTVFILVYWDKKVLQNY